MTRLNRRSFVKASGLALAAAGAARLGWPRAAGQAAPAGPAAATPPAGGTMLKCISMGPLDLPAGDDQDLSAYGNIAHVLESGSGWVRLWARWDLLQPRPPGEVPLERLADPAANPGAGVLLALDAQIALARAQGLGVILTSWLFPPWANGTAHLVEGSPEERAFLVADRMSRALALTGDFEGRRKRLFYRVPPHDQLGVDGAWGQWVRFLYQRYAAHGGGFALELINEPNLQWWPQQGPSTTGDPFGPGPLVAPALAARMMQTAQAIAQEHGQPILIAAPGTADGPRGEPLPGNTRTFTNYESFTLETLAELDRLGFAAGGQFVWTHHNYVDMLFDAGADTGVRNRAAHVRAMLTGRWAGWPQGGARNDFPGIWLTEGGVDLREDHIAGDKEMQSLLVQRNWDRMSRADGDGAGIGMVTNYLNYTDPKYDTGLRDALADGGQPRPVASTWGALARS